MGGSTPPLGGEAAEGWGTRVLLAPRRLLKASAALALVKSSQWKLLSWSRAASRVAQVVGGASSMAGMRMGSAPRVRSWSASSEPCSGARVTRTRGPGAGVVGAGTVLG